MKITFHSAILAFALAGLSLSPALAGNENTLVLKQEGAGNTISIDQQNAYGSQIGGVRFEENSNLEQSEFEILDMSDPLLASEGLDNPILQLGDGNSAEITIEGNDDVVYLQQNSQGQATGNTADIYVNSGTGDPSFAAVVQEGANNNASVSIDGSLSNGTVLQRGNNNDGAVTIDGNNINAELTQVGSSNEGQLSVQSSASSSDTGANVSYTLYANGVTTTQPVTVTTNGASVSITQTQF
nr:hypothetical protein [uncultured Cohaesibacter sp.]